MIGTGASLSYSVDAEDRIASVDHKWYPFAAANGAPELVPEAVIGRSLRTFIADRATNHFTQALLTQARRGRTVTFPLRCDGPDHRREMRMELTPEPRNHVRCTTTLIAESSLPPLPVRSAEPTGAILTMCGWCNQILFAERWHDLADGVNEAVLFLRPAMRDISHGICPRCAILLDPTEAALANP